MKRQENPAKHSSLVLCQGAILRQKKPHTSEAPQVLKFLLPAITNADSLELVLIYGK